MEPNERPRSFAVVTTCHAEGFEQYGHTMVETFDRHWSPRVPLSLYQEEFEYESASARVHPVDLLDSSPELVAFKSRHSNNPRAHGRQRRPKFRGQAWPPRLQFAPSWGLGYRWDAVRFAHKTFAILHAAASTDADVLIWLDSDTRFFADVDDAMLERFLPRGSFVACLRRKHMWTETGFVAYNMRHSSAPIFFAALRSMYVDDRLFEEREYHDAWLFDRTLEQLRLEGADVHDLGGGIGDIAQHVLINSWLGSFMDHRKGNRKFEAGLRPGDLIIPGRHAYWSDGQKS